MSDVRWTMTDRGFKHYAPVETVAGTVLVYESSAATEPKLWLSIDAGSHEHLTLAQAAEMRDSLDEGAPLRDTLSMAIERHYQVWDPDPAAWRPGDVCVLCGSRATGLDSDVAWCRDCGAREDAP